MIRNQKEEVEGVCILVDIVVAEHYICRLAILVRDRDGNYTTTIVGEANLHAVGILEGN